MSTAAARNVEASPAPPVSMGKGELLDIAIAELHESPLNPRQFYPDQAMAELTESIRQDGFREWLPIVVRLRAEGGYEIAAGHRRSRAAAAAGLTSVPCLLRPMGDSEFLDVLNFDNSGREDVHPLHEAAGWRVWMEKTGKGVLDIAAKIGQSKEYVYQRLKYADLIEPAREAFLDGKISAGHAILIARLQPPGQKKALKFCEPPKWDPDKHVGVRDLAAFIQRDIHLGMSKANFDLSDASLLAGVGSCDACPKRTINSPELILGVTVNADECTDPGCFSMKLTNHIVRLKAEVREKTGQDLIEICSGYEAPRKKGVLGYGEYQITEPGKKGAKPAIVVQGESAGKLVTIRVNAESSPSQSSGASSPQANGPDPIDEAQREREAAALKARVDCERSVRIAILQGIRNKIGVARNLAKWEIAELVRMVLDADISRSGLAELLRIRGFSVEMNGEWDDTPFIVMDGKLSSLSHEEMLRLAVELPLTGDFDHASIVRNDQPKKLLEVARSYGVDHVKIRRETEKAAKQAEGGTQREVEKPAAQPKAGKPKKKKTAAKRPSATKSAPAKKKAGKTKK